ARALSPGGEQGCAVSFPPPPAGRGVGVRGKTLLALGVRPLSPGPYPFGGEGRPPLAPRPPPGGPPLLHPRRRVGHYVCSAVRPPVRSVPISQVPQTPSVRFGGFGPGDPAAAMWADRREAWQHGERAGNLPRWLPQRETIPRTPRTNGPHAKEVVAD